MILTIFITLLSFINMNSIMLYDFTNDESDKWNIINDGVMGGISSSSFTVNDGIATFSGNVLPDNNGGFASVRATIKKDDLKDFDGVEIKVKGDGKIYNLRFRNNRNIDGISYQAKFKSEKDNWTTVKIPFEKFEPTFRGRIIPDQPALISEEIEQVGILIADKQFGEFTIDIDYIKIYKAD